jgi:hypothetical protein
MGIQEQKNIVQAQLLDSEGRKVVQNISIQSGEEDSLAEEKSDRYFRRNHH